MKKLLLFCLLASVPAFGQAYSSSVTQNSPGNYGRPVPYATVVVCAVGDTAVPCTQKSVTYTTTSLATQCTMNAASGVLTGSPTSGTNCNNPGIADINGNFTIFVTPGQYMICTYANTWLCQPQSIGTSTNANPSFSCPGALNGSLMATLSPTTASCDPHMGTDFNGNGFAQSWKYLGPVNGFFGMIGGAPDPGTVPAYKLNTNEVRMLAPLTVPTPYYFRPPSTRCTTGQGWQMTGETTDANGDKVDTYGCATFASSGGVQAQVNGTNFANCAGGPPCSSPLINFIDAATTPAGLGLTWSNPSGGQVQPVLNDGSTRATNPSIPVATVNGTPASTDYKYAVVGCEDINCTYHSALSPVVDVSTGAATITSVNSITLSAYADTLYGYRFYKVCRTASSGTPATVGAIATGAGKAFIDTGLSGDGSNCASVFSTNTTVLSPIPCLASFSPGGNSMPGAPCGIDAPPLSPDSTNNENTEQFGAPGDANNPWWTLINAGAATFSWTGGTLAIANAAGVDQLNCVFRTAASTPYGYVTNVAYNVTIGGNVTANLALRESATGKIVTIGGQIQNGGNSGRLIVAHFTNATTNSSFTPVSTAVWVPNPIYIKVGYDGTNTEYKWSADGLVYTNGLTEAKTAFFTTAPDQVGLCLEAPSGTGSVEYDYLRKVTF